MAKRVIIGLGTGRCGTTSLVGLLKLQTKAPKAVTHLRRRLRWQCDLALALEVARELVESPEDLSADVGCFWLPYAYNIAQTFPSIRFLCLFREKAAYIESWINSQPGRNPWIEQSGAPNDLAYPNWGIPDTAAAAGAYWQSYMLSALELEAALFERFRIFYFGHLNTESGQREMLRFVGIENPVVQVPIHLNRRGVPWNKRLEGFG